VQQIETIISNNSLTHFKHIRA